MRRRRAHALMLALGLTVSLPVAAGTLLSSPVPASAGYYLAPACPEISGVNVWESGDSCYRQGCSDSVPGGYPKQWNQLSDGTSLNCGGVWNNMNTAAFGPSNDLATAMEQCDSHSSTTANEEKCYAVHIGVASDTLSGHGDDLPNTYVNTWYMVRCANSNLFVDPETGMDCNVNAGYTTFIRFPKSMWRHNACPEGTNSPAGATSITACTASAGYYAGLNADGKFVSGQCPGNGALTSIAGATSIDDCNIVVPAAAGTYNAPACSPIDGVKVWETSQSCYRLGCSDSVPGGYPMAAQTGFTCGTSGTAQTLNQAQWGPANSFRKAMEQCDTYSSSTADKERCFGVHINSAYTTVNNYDYDDFPDMTLNTWYMTQCSDSGSVDPEGMECTSSASYTSFIRLPKTSTANYACPEGTLSSPGATSIFGCIAQTGYYLGLDSNGVFKTGRCPGNGAFSSLTGSTSIDDCTIVVPAPAGFYTGLACEPIYSGVRVWESAESCYRQGCSDSVPGGYPDSTQVLTDGTQITCGAYSTQQNINNAAYGPTNSFGTGMEQCDIYSSTTANKEKCYGVHINSGYTTINCQIAPRTSNLVDVVYHFPPPLLT